MGGPHCKKHHKISHTGIHTHQLQSWSIEIVLNVHCLDESNITLCPHMSNFIQKDILDTTHPLAFEGIAL